ncbi:hypothetical protein VNO77_02398 [Canavalia gladiata]|uniref:Uncharacterized protein n=1 Tax=Canavalia gladiata TaxID=3824 RepID=A0AAN9MTR0_CANGL
MLKQCSRRPYTAIETLGDGLVYPLTMDQEVDSLMDQGMVELFLYINIPLAQMAAFLMCYMAARCIICMKNVDSTPLMSFNSLYVWRPCRASFARLETSNLVAPRNLLYCMRLSSTCHVKKGMCRMASDILKFLCWFGYIVYLSTQILHNAIIRINVVTTLASNIEAGKGFALHTGDGCVVWSLLLHTLRKSKVCERPTGLNIYQWQVPHHHAWDGNPSILVVGHWGPSVAAPAFLSFIDVYAGKEVHSLSLAHTVDQVIPLLYTDSTEERLYLIIDANQHAYLYPRTTEALNILQHEFSNVYWYNVETDNGVIRGHALKNKCIDKAVDEYCFDFRDLWSIVFPSESEKIITTVTRKENEVVHTQAKVMTDYDAMYEYILKNVPFVANVALKAKGEIGIVTPEEAGLVIHVIDALIGRILHRMTHYDCQVPVHVVFSENWVGYHYFILRAHRCEMSILSPTLRIPLKWKPSSVVAYINYRPTITQFGPAAYSKWATFTLPFYFQFPTCQSDFLGSSDYWPAVTQFGPH